MLSRNDILETIRMIDQQHLDIRTITMGISLLSCADSSAERACEKIYDKISRHAEHLVATGEEIWTKEVVDAVIEIVRRDALPEGGYKYGCRFIGMPDTDALKIDIYQIFNDL